MSAPPAGNHPDAFWRRPPEGEGGLDPRPRSVGPTVAAEPYVPPPRMEPPSPRSEPPPLIVPRPDPLVLPEQDRQSFDSEQASARMVTWSVAIVAGAFAVLLVVYLLVLAAG